MGSPPSTLLLEERWVLQIWVCLSAPSNLQVVQMHFPSNLHIPEGPLRGCLHPAPCPVASSWVQAPTGVHLAWAEAVMMAKQLLEGSHQRIWSFILERQCPGFGQNRVNFDRNPGRGTAGGWGLTPPGQTEPGIPHHVTSRWVPVEGGRHGGKALAAWGGATSVLFRESGCLYGSLLCFLLICIVVVPVFPLFAVLLNCPYPDPPVSASFFSFSSARRRGEGRSHGAFVAGSSRNRNREEHSLQAKK